MTETWDINKEQNIIFMKSNLNKMNKEGINNYFWFKNLQQTT